MINQRFKLNRLVEQKDFDYLEGAGLGWCADSSGHYAFNAFSNDILTSDQIRALERRDYFTVPDYFLRPVEKRELPNPKKLARLSINTLEKQLKDSNEHRAKIQEALDELSKIGGYIDVITVTSIFAHYQYLDKKLEQESFRYMDAITAKR